VGEYWVVDPELESVKIYRRVNNRYERVAELSKEANDFISTPYLPSWEMTLTEIFE
jgi:Uma2 family endonuclease